MAIHTSVLAWRIPGTEEPGGLLSMGSHRVGHDWSDLAAAAAASGFLSGLMREWLWFSWWLKTIRAGPGVKGGVGGRKGPWWWAELSLDRIWPGPEIGLPWLTNSLFAWWPRMGLNLSTFPETLIGRQHSQINNSLIIHLLSVAFFEGKNACIVRVILP